MVQHSTKADLQRNLCMLCPHSNTRSGWPCSIVLWSSSAALSVKLALYLSFITVKNKKNTYALLKKLSYCIPGKKYSGVLFTILISIVQWAAGDQIIQYGWIHAASHWQ